MRARSSFVQEKFAPADNHIRVYFCYTSTVSMRCPGMVTTAILAGDAEDCSYHMRNPDRVESRDISHSGGRIPLIEGSFFASGDLNSLSADQSLPVD